MFASPGSLNHRSQWLRRGQAHFHGRCRKALGERVKAIEAMASGWKTS